MNKPKVAWITDSTSSLNQDFIKQHNIHCIKVSDCRWNKKQETQNKNWNSEFNNYFSKLFHNSPHFYVCDVFLYIYPP